MADKENAEIALPAKVVAESLASKLEDDKVEAIKNQLENSESSAKTKQKTATEKYLWYKAECDPAQYGGQTHYWIQIKTNEARWEEPQEPYWIWNAATQSADKAGLQYPKLAHLPPAMTASATEPEEIIERYNPKIHGNYDPTAPYAKYYEQKEAAERAAAGEQELVGITRDEHYAAMATFNAATGAFQNAEQNAEHHNDYNKSARQLGAFFDVDAAANAHNGKSLKAERQAQQHTRQEIKEFAEKRKEKKRKKRMAFLLS